MIDLTEYDWTSAPPHDKWVKVLCHNGDDWIEQIARRQHGYWTFAPGLDIVGPPSAWRELREGEKP